VADTNEYGRELRGVQLVLLLLFTLLVLRHAWMMDDAYITLRTVDNFFAGLGLVWNPGERVQAYTHPLWLFICIAVHAVTREYFYSLLIVGALMSTGALAIITLKLSRSQWVAISLLLVAMLSHAFVDYSTSGLENPLTHLLIGLFAWVYLGKLPGERQLRLLCLIGGLSLLSRPDNAVLLGPAVIAAAVQAYRRGTKVRALLRAVLIGGIPLFAWELFSLLYYGMLVPNTALAKLNAGIPAPERIEQGLFYFVATLDLDPLTLVIVLVGMVAPLLAGQRRLLPFAIGILLHLLYTIDIGGDFMLGRFFVAPMYMAMLCLSRLRCPRLPVLGIVTAILVLLGLSARPNTFEINSKTTEAPDKARTRRMVTDERTLLFVGNSLVESSRMHEIPHAGWWGRAKPDKKVQSEIALGYRGFVNGPDVHWIDKTALGDPLLSRLPALHRPDWMMGHFFRAMPDGYAETLETGENLIEDPSIAAMYDRLGLVVRGDLFSLDRLRAIWWLNTGGPDEFINPETWRYKEAITIRRSKLGWRVADGTAITHADVHRFNFTGVYVKFKSRQHPEVIEISISGWDAFEMRFFDGLEEVARVPVPRALGRYENGMVVRRIEAPEELTERGFWRLRIVPMTKQRSKGPYYAIGHVLFDDEIDSALPVAQRPVEQAKPNAKAKPPAKAKPNAKAKPKPDTRTPKPQPPVTRPPVTQSTDEGFETAAGGPTRPPDPRRQTDRLESTPLHDGD
jgi:arabinofuranosyltransferase